MTQTRVIACDRCGVRVSLPRDPAFLPDGWKRASMDGGFGSDAHYGNLDLCHECACDWTDYRAAAFTAFLKDKPKRTLTEVK